LMVIFSSCGLGAAVRDLLAAFGMGHLSTIQVDGWAGGTWRRRPAVLAPRPCLD
jgi:hypothetical protein